MASPGQHPEGHRGHGQLRTGEQQVGSTVWRDAASYAFRHQGRLQWMHGMFLRNPRVRFAFDFIPRPPDQTAMALPPTRHEVAPSAMSMCAPSAGYGRDNRGPSCAGPPASPLSGVPVRPPSARVTRPTERSANAQTTRRFPTRTTHPRRPVGRTLPPQTPRRWKISVAVFSKPWPSNSRGTEAITPTPSS